MDGLVCENNRPRGSRKWQREAKAAASRRMRLPRPATSRAVEGETILQSQRNNYPVAPIEAPSRSQKGRTGSCGVRSRDGKGYSASLRRRAGTLAQDFGIFEDLIEVSLLNLMPLGCNDPVFFPTFPSTIFDGRDAAVKRNWLVVDPWDEQDISELRVQH